MKATATIVIAGLLAEAALPVDGVPVEHTHVEVAIDWTVQRAPVVRTTTSSPFIITHYTV
jgi:hypothetical protein